MSSALFHGMQRGNAFGTIDKKSTLENRFFVLSKGVSVHWRVAVNFAAKGSHDIQFGRRGGHWPVAGMQSFGDNIGSIFV
jgi:hypothetical protein